MMADRRKHVSMQGIEKHSYFDTLPFDMLWTFWNQHVGLVSDAQSS